MSARTVAARPQRARRPRRDRDGPGGVRRRPGRRDSRDVQVVAENFWGNIAGQIGGRQG